MSFLHYLAIFLHFISTSLFTHLMYTPSIPSFCDYFPNFSMSIIFYLPSWHLPNLISKSPEGKSRASGPHVPLGAFFAQSRSSAKASLAWITWASGHAVWTAENSNKANPRSNPELAFSFPNGTDHQALPKHPPPSSMVIVLIPEERAYFFSIDPSRLSDPLKATALGALGPWPLGQEEWTISWFIRNNYRDASVEFMALIF